MPRRRLADPIPERTFAGGVLSLGTYELALLHGLLDRPGGIAVGRLDLIRAAWPYALRLKEPGTTLHNALRKNIPRLSTYWVARYRRGRLTCYHLLPRGRAVLEGLIPARLGGRGWYVPKALRGGR